MKFLYIDVETYSDINIATSGAYKYTESENFEILLFAYAFDSGEVQLIDMTKEELPEHVKDALGNPNIIKSSFNANFERNAIKNYLNSPTPPEMWQCSMIKALTIGLPGSLGMVGKAMHLEEDKQKMKEGKALIQYFCKPCKATKANGGRTRNLPEHDVEKWEIFKSYCIQDVEVERDIRNKLSIYQTTDTEQRLWELDQRINDRGVGTDLVIIERAIECDSTYSARLKNEAKQITGLANPNSAAQLKKWIGDRLGHEVTSLTKESVPVLLEEAEDENIIRILELRQLMAKTSIKKYQTMKNSRCSDGRIRGLLQFYGANRTGRWCIAEGTPILVRGSNGSILEKSIENVLLSDMVWDGCEWVNHEGVVCSGDKEVITWDGITATAEHVVYISDDVKMTLSEAQKRGLKLWQGNI